MLEHYPRDELFQIDEDTLYRFIMTILQLDERPRVRVMARLDRFDRFVSVLVYVPRERYDSHIRARIGDYLAQTFDGRVSAFYPFFPEGPMVRVHFIIGRSGAGHAAGRPEQARARRRRHRAHLGRRAGRGAGARPIRRTRRTNCSRATATPLPPRFHAFYSPQTAAADIRVIERLSEQRPLAVDFHHLPDGRQPFGRS